jgi:hypothetical protein
MNYEIVKSRIVMLTGRQKTDVAVSWMLQPTARPMLGESEIQTTTETSLK